MKDLYFVLFLTLLLSCQPMKDKEMISEGMQGGKIFFLENYNEIATSNKIIKNVKYIPLELNNDIIGNITKILLTKDKILIFDRISKHVFSFDHEGKFLRRIGNVGKGPGEINFLNDFDVDEDGNIYLLDIGFTKILRFDPEGNYVGERTFGFLTSGFGCVNNLEFVFDQQGRSNKGTNGANLDYRLLSWNIKNRSIQQKYFPYSQVYDTPGFPNPSNLFRSEGNLLYNTPYDYGIYEIQSEMIHKKYQFDFGKYNIPENFFNVSGSLSSDEKIELITKLMTSKYVSGLNSPFESCDFLITWFNINKRPFLFVYFKNQDKFLIKNALDIESSELPAGFIPYGVYNNEVVGVIDHYYFNKLNEDFKNGPLERKEFLRSLNLDFILNYDEQSFTPIIVLYSLKGI